MRSLATGLLLAMTLLARPVSAMCLGSGEPHLEALVQEIGRHLERALVQIEQAIAGTPATQQRAQAWLGTARAAAAGMLGRDDLLLPEAVKQAQATLAADDPALLYLQVAELIMGRFSGDVRSAVAALRPALSRQPPDAESTVCITASLAYLLSRSGYPEDAFPLAAEAYRRSAGGGMPWGHAEAAATLAQVVRFQADRDYAVALNTEALTYFTAAGMHDMAANELAMRGWARMSAKDAATLQAAEADFLGSIAAARRAGNEVAVAYAHSGLCELRVAAKRLVDARPVCESGYQAMRGSGDHAEYGATTNFASFLLESGRPAEALKLLDGVLTANEGQPRGYFSYVAHEARGRAHAALGDHRRAFADAQKAVSVLKAIEDRARDKSAAVTRARFQTDQLSHSLARKTQQHEDSLRRNWLIGGFGSVVVLLLAVIVYVMARHRRIYRRLAFTDALTGVPNRRYTETRILEMLAHARARRQPMTVSILDLDHFKSCNDRYGHDAGDEALRAFASAAGQAIRPGDVFGRWGGEEFLLALPDSDESRTRSILERIRSAAAQTQLSLAPDYPLRFSAGAVSAGAVSAGAAETTLAELLAAADQALYRAKAEGRNRTCFVANAPADECVA